MRPSEAENAAEAQKKAQDVAKAEANALVASQKATALAAKEALKQRGAKEWAHFVKDAPIQVSMHMYHNS